MCYPIAGGIFRERSLAQSPEFIAGAPSQRFIKGNSERIKIAPGIDRTIQPPGLFRRHIRDRPKRTSGSFLVLRSNENGSADVADSPASVDKSALFLP